MIDQEPKTSAEPSITLNPAIRRVASILIAAHLLAIFSAPWSFPAPSSELSRRFARIFEPYQTLTFTRHGYRFFAPDPGPSHLIRYEIDMPEGNVVTGRIPDRDTLWPRLMYHRHLMMSEICFSIEDPVQSAPDPTTLTPEEQIEYEKVKHEIEAATAFAEILRKSIARQLIDKYGGDRIRLYMDLHTIPAPDQIRAGKKLNDAEFYESLGLLREFSKDEL